MMHLIKSKIQKTIKGYLFKHNRFYMIMYKIPKNFRMQKMMKRKMIYIKTTNKEISKTKTVANI